MYFAAVAPPAPPPITATRGLAPKASEGTAKAVVPASIPPVNCRLENFVTISSLFTKNPLMVKKRTDWAWKGQT